MQECGGVIIRFPPEKSASDKVIIRGPKEDVDKAKKQLLELASDRVSSIITKKLFLISNTTVFGQIFRQIEMLNVFITERTELHCGTES